MHTIQDQIAELNARIINKEIEIDCMDPRKEAGQYQVRLIELEVLKEQLKEIGE